MSLARPLATGMNRPYKAGMDQRASGSAPPQPTLSGSVTSFGTTTVAYSSSITAANGTAPYTWSVSAGSLPAGLTLNSSTGVISGTPTAGAVYNFTLLVTDANSQTASSAQTITTAVYPALSGTLTFATISVAYSQGLTLTGGHSPAAWDISAGTLPAGLSINSSTGVISGTPTAYGDNTFTVRATDAHGNVVTSAQSVTVYGPEMAGSVTDGSWTLSLNGGAAGTVTQDGSGIHFVGSQNIAAASHTITGVDGGIFEMTYTVANRTSGNMHNLCYGATLAHSGTGSTRSTNGTFTERVTCSAAGSFTNQVRIQATGANGTNNFDITAFSCKRVG